MTIGEYITQYRDAHNISGRTFAKMCDLSANYIRILESGVNTNGSKVTPTLETYERISRAVGVPLLDLLGALEDDVILNAEYTLEEQSLILLYRKASDRDKNLIKQILETYEQDTSSSASLLNENAG